MTDSNTIFMIWRNIDGYNGVYQISDSGEVRSNKTNTILKKTLRNRKQGRYYTISIFTNQDKKPGRTKLFLVHRLVAKAFPEICGEWFEGCEVHHKDRNPMNNSAENLQVLSREKHIKIHQDKECPKHKLRQIYQYDLKWNFIKVFDSTFAAASDVFGGVEQIRNACRKGTSYKGYRWLYA